MGLTFICRDYSSTPVCVSPCLLDRETNLRAISCHQLQFEHYRLTPVYVPSCLQDRETELRAVSQQIQQLSAPPSPLAALFSSATASAPTSAPSSGSPGGALRRGGMGGEGREGSVGVGGRESLAGSLRQRVRDLVSGTHRELVNSSWLAWEDIVR